jgi:ubiquinone/menaquinone biosynthesis C-methylase UbiE
LPEITDFKTEDAASYDEVAETFDDLTNKYAGQSARALSLAVDGPNRKKILDVGCGTGIVAFSLADHAGSKTQIVGVDLSAGMLQTANARAADKGVADRVSFQVGDAEELDFKDGSFDGYVSLNAYSHFPHPDRAAAEAFRVLSPGGKVAVAVGSGPPLATIQGLKRAVAAIQRKIQLMNGTVQVACEQLERLVREHLKSVSTPESSPWMGSRREFSQVLRDTIGAAGFVDIRQQFYGSDFAIPTIEDFWQLQTTISTPARKRMAAASKADLAKLKAAFWAECEAVQAKGGKLTYRVGAALVSGRKPGV